MRDTSAGLRIFFSLESESLKSKSQKRNAFDPGLQTLGLQTPDFYSREISKWQM
jgi:hypothetical protein